MDLTKKRKAEDNGEPYPAYNEFNDNPSSTPSGVISPEIAQKILEPMTKEQLLPILRAAILNHPDVLQAVRAVADSDPAQRKLFVRGLGWDTTTEKLRQVFSVYGELDEGNTIVITDKNTAKSKGYGFVTFKHIDGAILSLKEPNKKIDGRMTVSQLAAARNSGNSQPVDVSLRKVYVGNVPFEISSERLLSYFSAFGEIEEGPLGFDKQSGKAKGFAFFVYKTEEGAQATLAEPPKIIDGHQVVCKLATDNKRQNPNVGPIPGNAPMPNQGYSHGMASSNYTGYPGYAPGPIAPQPQQHGGMMHQNASYNPGMAGPGVQGYPGARSDGAMQYNGAAGGYRMPPTTVAMQGTSGYPDAGNYGPQPGYQAQQNLPVTGPGPRPAAYQGMPQYY